MTTESKSKQRNKSNDVGGTAISPTTHWRSVSINSTTSVQTFAAPPVPTTSCAMPICLYFTYAIVNEDLLTILLNVTKKKIIKHSVHVTLAPT